MTNKELIDLLSTMPQDATVIFDDKWELAVSDATYEEEYCADCKKVHKIIKLKKCKIVNGA